MNSIMMFLMISKTFNFIGSGIQIPPYGVYVQELLIQVSLVILSVHWDPVQPQSLWICLWMLLIIRFILMLLKRIKTTVTNKHLIITVSLEPTAIITSLTPDATITP